MIKVFAISYLFAVATAAPAAEAEAKAVADAEAEADPYYHAIGYQNTIPAPNCKTEHEVLTTQTCVPSTENVCETKTVETEEIEYEKVCKEVMETLCDQPAYGYHNITKREADAEAEAEAVADPDADPLILASSSHVDQDLPAPILANPFAHVPAVPATVGHVPAPIAHVPAPIAHVPAPIAHVPAAAHVAHVPAAPVVAAPVVPAPVAHAVPHSVTSKVKHACREVTTEHCVSNPKVKLVPVEVEHCHVVTKVKCSDVDNKIPKTTCEPVETVHLNHATYSVPAHIAHKPQAFVHGQGHHGY